MIVLNDLDITCAMTDDEIGKAYMEYPDGRRECQTYCEG